MFVVLQPRGRGERDCAFRRRAHAEVERRGACVERPTGQPHESGEGDCHQEEQHLHRPPEVHDPPNAIPHHSEPAGIPVTRHISVVQSAASSTRPRCANVFLQSRTILSMLLRKLCAIAARKQWCLSHVINR